MSWRTILTRAAVLALVADAHAILAQTIYVDTSADVVDFGGAQQVADLPGPDGRVSLAEAGLASDNTLGVQTIGFHVPPAEWLFQQFFPGRAVLRPLLGFRVFDTAILDATTQTAFSGDTYPQGGEVVIWAETYLVDNVGSLMHGFDSTSVSLSGGSDNVVQGNTNMNVDVYDSPRALIGGTSPGQGNTCGTIKIDRANQAVVVGNTTTRVRVLGWFGGGQPAVGNRIGGPTPAERNYITGYGTWSSEGYPGGTTVQIFDSIDTLVENNWIGTTPDGLAQGSQASTQGIGFEGENHGAVIRGNRIAGILGHGIGPHYSGWLVGSAIDVYGIGSDLTIAGNTIGLDANDQPLLGSVTGIMTRNYYLGIIEGVVIGGPTAAEANVIAGHLATGITIASTYAGVRIAGNSIHDNKGIGIDLVTPTLATGVTPNDPLDADVGGNGLQNFPVLQSATRVGNSTRVVGTLGSSAGAAYALEFFASPQADGSGFGEGQQFLGTAAVATDAAGNAAFDAILTAPVEPGWFVAATSTHASSGSTSEFSASVAAAGAPLAWGDLGHGLAGASGVPQLGGSGGLGAGSTVALSASAAAAFAPAWYVVGLSQLQLSIAGGLLVPYPDIVVARTTGASGTSSLSVPVAQPLPAGQEVSVQLWVLDLAGPMGWSASNAIAAAAP